MKITKKERIYKRYMLNERFIDFLEKKYAYRIKNIYNFINLIEDVTTEVLKEKGLIEDADNE